MKDNDSSTDEDAEEILPFPKFVNIIEKVEPLRQYMTKYDRQQINARPRQIHISSGPTRPTSPWSVAKSFFASYQLDTDELMKKCFDFDWGCSVIDRMIRNPEQSELVRSYLKPRYRIM